MPPRSASAHHDGTSLNCGMGHFYFALTGAPLYFDSHHLSLTGARLVLATDRQAAARVAQGSLMVHD